MTVTAGHLGTASEPFVRELAQRLVGSRRPPQTLLLRSRPFWDGPETFEVANRTVRVGVGLSQLDVLDQITRLGDEEYLVVLTARSETDLGETVLMRAHRQRIEELDEWESITQLFGAKDLERGLRREGAWVAAALLTHRPPSGWPHVTTGLLTRDHAFSCLLARLLDLPATTNLDDARLLAALDDEDKRASWREADEDLRDGLEAWSRNGIGPVAALALAAAARPTAVSPVALGLALDVLWPATKQPETHAQSQAQARIEQRLGERRPSEAEARAYADEARRLLSALDTQTDPARSHIRAQAESLLADLGWADGAAHSDVLPTGLWSRLHRLADALDGTGISREDALGAVREHALCSDEADEVARAEMAVRLGRWLVTERDRPTRIGDALLRYAHDGGWADRAYESVWVGSSAPQVAAAYRRLLDRVLAERRRQDEHTANLLADATANDGPTTYTGSDGQVFPVESLVPELVTPLARQTPVLLVVLDGMAMRVATELAESLTGWNEIVAEGTTRRAAALSVLPTVTTYARTSLFSGRLATGQQADEKRAFAGPLFHKADLRSPAGSRLPEEVSAAIAGTQRTVGVVLNTIDDALSKHDPGGTHWTVHQVQHLEALLRAAHGAGRTVVLTSDHGHVVEHDSAVRSITGADARWRPDNGPAGDGEVRVAGRRVLAPGGSAVLPWREDIRYASLQAGYHGGASAAELTVPVLVLAGDARGTPSGWVAAIPQAPAWWHEAVAAPVVERETPAPTRRRSRPQKPAADQETLQLDIPPTEPFAQASPAPDLVDGLLASEMYHAQRTKAGRVALPDEQVAAVLRTLLAGNDRLHRDTLAASAGISEATLNTRLVALRRMLNVEGYPVIEQDPDGVTVVLDKALLREQFELP